MAQCYPRVFQSQQSLFCDFSPVSPEPPAPSLLAAAVHELRNPQTLWTPMLPWKSHFSLLSLLSPSWADCSHIHLFSGMEILPLFLCQCWTLISDFCCCLGSPRGKFPFIAAAPCWELLSLCKLLKLLGFFCKKYILQPELVKLAAPAVHPDFFPLCLLNYRLLLLSFVKAIWNLNPPCSSFQLPIKIPKFNEYNLQSFSRSLMKHWRAQTPVSLLCKQHHSIYPEFSQGNYFPIIISWWVLRADGAGGSVLVIEGKSEGFASCETVKCHCFPEGIVRNAKALRFLNLVIFSMLKIAKTVGIVLWTYHWAPVYIFIFLRTVLWDFYVVIINHSMPLYL